MIKDLHNDKEVFVSCNRFIMIKDSKLNCKISSLAQLIIIIRINDTFYIITSSYIFRLYPFDLTSDSSIIYLRR